MIARGEADVAVLPKEQRVSPAPATCEAPLSMTTPCFLFISPLHVLNELTNTRKSNTNQLSSIFVPWRASPPPQQYIFYIWSSNQFWFVTP